MRQLQVQVFQSVDSRRENKVLFERIIDVNESVQIPFNSLCSDLKFLFGSCVIQFSLV